ncbi:MAG: hypothetical protein GXY84_09765 [Clostridiales bacterium]|nr:hypothetical protein [Clostridiales bacterium]
MTLEALVSQLNAITEGMFAGSVPCRASRLNFVMKTHPANAFFSLYQPLVNMLWGSDRSGLTADFLRQVYEDLKAYQAEARLGALAKPLRELREMVGAMKRGEPLALFED